MTWPTQVELTPYEKECRSRQRRLFSFFTGGFEDYEIKLDMASEVPVRKLKGKNLKEFFSDLRKECFFRMLLYQSVLTLDFIRLMSAVLIILCTTSALQFSAGFRSRLPLAPEKSDKMIEGNLITVAFAIFEIAFSFFRYDTMRRKTRVAIAVFLPLEFMFYSALMGIPFVVESVTEDLEVRMIQDMKNFTPRKSINEDVRWMDVIHRTFLCCGVTSEHTAKMALKWAAEQAEIDYGDGEIRTGLANRTLLNEFIAIPFPCSCEVNPTACRQGELRKGVVIFRLSCLGQITRVLNWNSRDVRILSLSVAILGVFVALLRFGLIITQSLHG
ncbi:unnamed protein product [Cyprideis torosa]|uniref:Uncharacterized protein n=1 Tax=Cyprideis torosa TaxID=163714 RepID=A0A7R8W7D6_9CRUS|nr:unnamed protein product [Cyprideis torosa]CAG0885072.1 unnamed protein product [Cyprideis torosa]